MNLRVSLLNILLVCNAHVSFSQISTRELPISFSKDLNEITGRAVKGETLINLKTPDMKRIYQEDSVRKRNPDAPIRTSVPIHVNLNSTRNGFWTDLEDGGKIWQYEYVKCYPFRQYPFNQSMYTDGQQCKYV